MDRIIRGLQRKEISDKTKRLAIAQNWLLNEEQPQESTAKALKSMQLFPMDDKTLLTQKWNRLAKIYNKSVPKTLTEGDVTVLAEIQGKLQAWSHFAEDRIASIDDEAVIRQVTERSGMSGVQMAEAIIADVEKGNT
jgi:hypothetical protein